MPVMFINNPSFIPCFQMPLFSYMNSHIYLALFGAVGQIPCGGPCACRDPRWTVLPPVLVGGSSPADHVLERVVATPAPRCHLEEQGLSSLSFS